MNDELQESPEYGRIHLHNAIAKLPAHEPDEQAWAQIVQQLNVAALHDGHFTLPEHEPDELVWDNIVAQLGQEEPTATSIQTQMSTPNVRRMWPTKQVLRVGAMAASWLLALLAWHYWPSTTPVRIVAQERISYSEENLPQSMTAREPLPLPNDAAEEHEGMAFINAQCTKVPVGCQSPEFQTLKKQMVELDAEEKRLQREVKRFGNNPELIRYQTRVTTMKATVTKELIQLLIS